MIGGLLFQFKGKAIPAGKEGDVLAALQKKIPLVTGIFCNEAGVEVRTRQPMSESRTMVLRSGTGGARRVRMRNNPRSGLRTGISSALDEIIPTLEQ